MEKELSLQEGNKMGTMPVNKLLISMSLPMIISMLVQALYNVVDSIFVAQLSEEALTAVGLAVPMQNLMIAAATGMGVGINALLSRSLGEKDLEKANDSATQGLFLVFICYLIFLAVGLFATRAFVGMQTDLEGIIDYGSTYLRICCIFSFGIFAQLTFERLLQSTGKTFYTMITQMTGAVINIILDPILIFGYFGFPKMGVTGAATATVVGQIVAAIMAIYFHMTKNTDIKINFKGFRPKRRIIKNLLYVGIPSILMQAIGSVMNFGINKILMTFTPTATAVFSIYFRLQGFVFMPIFGLNNGMVPIVAYNYGARNKERLTKTIKLSMIYAMAIMLIGFLLIQIFPEFFLNLFSASDNMMSIGVPALRTISLCFIFAGYGIIVSTVFQALGKGVQSLIISICRQLVVLLPAAYLLSKTGELSYVWFAFPIAEIASLILSTVFLLTTYKKIIKEI